MHGPRLSGGIVNLRPVEDDDLVRRVVWLNDAETVRLFTGNESGRPYDMVDAVRWRQSAEGDPFTLVWSIETKGSRHIGDVDIHEINRMDCRARLTILIGHKGFWGKGYGTDALKTLLEYVFGELGLNAIHLRVCDFNQRAIRCYEKCGFERTSSHPGVPGWQPGDIFMVATKESFAALEADDRRVHDRPTGDFVQLHTHT